jgi:hypothetical protein
MANAGLSESETGVPVVVDARYLSLSSLALLLLPLSTPRTVARDGGWGPCNGDRGGGHPRPHPRLPLVIVVVAQLGVVSRRVVLLSSLSLLLTSSSPPREHCS